MKFTKWFEARALKTNSANLKIYGSGTEGEYTFQTPKIPFKIKELAVLLRKHRNFAWIEDFFDDAILVTNKVSEFLNIEPTFGKLSVTSSDAVPTQRTNIENLIDLFKTNLWQEVEDETILVTKDFAEMFNTFQQLQKM